MVSFEKHTKLQDEHIQLLKDYRRLQDKVIELALIIETYNNLFLEIKLDKKSIN